MSRGGFYAWLRKPLSDRAREDQRLLGLIIAAYTARVGVDGAQRIFLDLREAGETCSELSVGSLGLCESVTSKRSAVTARFGTTELSLHFSLFDILQCGFTVPHPNRT